MNDTDLILIDADPKDASDFYLDHYREQLTAGWTKTTSEIGLRVFMVDLDKLKRGPVGLAPTRPAGSLPRVASLSFIRADRQADLNPLILWP